MKCYYNILAKLSNIFSRSFGAGPSWQGKLNPPLKNLKKIPSSTEGIWFTN